MATEKRGQNKDLFTISANSSPIGIYITQGGRFQFVNPQFERQTGYAASELLSMDPLALVTLEDREMVRASAISMLKGERAAPYEYRAIHKDGQTRWVLETVVSIQYKGQLATLGNSMDITERKELEQRLVHVASHDSLTDLPNRHMLEEAMKRSAARSRRGVQSALLYLDMDNLNEVNDALDYASGDQALIILVGLFKEQLRAGDLLARIGGGQFAVLLEGTPEEEIAAIAYRICRAVDRFELTLSGQVFKLSVSIGAVVIDGNLSPSVLLSRAEAAMYRAKEQGGNRVMLGIS